MANTIKPRKKNQYAKNHDVRLSKLKKQLHTSGSKMWPRHAKKKSDFFSFCTFVKKWIVSKKKSAELEEKIISWRKTVLLFKKTFLDQKTIFSLERILPWKKSVFSQFFFSKKKAIFFRLFLLWRKKRCDDKNIPWENIFSNIAPLKCSYYPSRIRQTPVWLQLRYPDYQTPRKNDISGFLGLSGPVLGSQNWVFFTF